MSNIILPKGWQYTKPQTASTFHAELEKELAEEHIMFNKQLTIVAHREGTDIVLCQHDDDTRHFTVIHLTWSGKQEADPKYPTVECDGDYDAFLLYVNTLD